MERVAFVEVLDRRGRVRDRVRLTRLPATIGRGYGNDVIVDDRYVSPEHCRIRLEQSGEVVLEDLGSLNGLRELHVPARVDRLELASGLRFRIGETTLRYVESDHPVPSAELLQRDTGVLQSLRSSRNAAGVVALALGVLTLQFHHADYYGSDTLSDTFLGLAGLALWAGIWAFVNRIVTHRFDFLRHLAWASLVTILVLALASVAEYVRFLFSADELASVMDVGLSLLGFGLLIGGHLAVVPASSRRGRRAWALASSGIFIAFVGVMAHVEENPSELPFEMPLKGFLVEWTLAGTTDDFLEQVRHTKEEVDELARGN